jgi:peptidoglycan hydrolase-like protein with peptidoglycan-binding domain
MSQPAYVRPGLEFGQGTTGETAAIKEAQADLRRTGYLRASIDGRFGDGTARAVKALQHDLLGGDGAGSDGSGPVNVKDYRAGRPVQVTGRLDQATAACLAAMAADPAFPKLPAAPDPRAANTAIRAQVAALRSDRAPIPFLIAMFRQESGFRQFNEPGAGDDDRFVIVGLDRNDAARPDRITSRGYGVGQHTLFHHPPRAEEIAGPISDPARNLAGAIAELRDKFDRFVNGATPGRRADDRIVEQGSGPLRACKYPADDPRYLSDCRACALAVGTVDIVASQTTWHRATTKTYEPTQYYAGDRASHPGTPNRAMFGCDWPYAVRRYNGGGVNSYHYQAIVQTNLAKA